MIFFSPETMGAVCAVVYLLTIIVFIPFPFYKDIVAATSGGGNRDGDMERQRVESGRLLHRFPHNKVSNIRSLACIINVSIVGFVSVCNIVPTVRCPSRHRRRFVRHSMAPQVLHSGVRLDSNACGIFRGLRRHQRGRSSTA